MRYATNTPHVSRGPAKAASTRLPLSLCCFVLVCALCVLASCVSAAPARPVSHATPSPTVHPPATYVAMGASDAVGVGADNPNTQGYVPILISRLPKDSQALNLGISGIELHDAIARELPQAIAAQPTLMTVWLVGNDFRDCVPLQQYGADFDALLTQLQTRTHAQLFVANLPDMSQLPYFQQGAPGGGACVQGASTAQVRALAQQWNAVINPIVAKHNAVLVDLFNSPLGTQPGLVSPRDGFHPSSKGYAVLADLFWSQITAHHALPNT